MKIIEVVASVGAESAGPSYSVPALCRAVAAAGGDVELHFAGKAPEERLAGLKHCAYPAERFPYPPLLRSPQMRKNLRKLARGGGVRVIHNHGIWLLPNIYCGEAVRGTDCRLVISPRGMLSAWSLNNSKWKKRLMWHFGGQRKMLFAADMFHVTCRAEFEEIRALGLTVPAAVIPNGVDVPPALPEKKPSAVRRLVFMSRLHPKKGLDMLLHSWGKLWRKHPEWRLEIAGPLEGTYPEELRRMIAELRLENAELIGEVTGQRKIDFLAGAELFVLPTYNENFGMAVAEALSCGTAAVVSKGAPWSGLEENGCGSWTDIDEAALCAALDEYMNMDFARLKQMGECGREWMKRDFSWEAAGEKMLAAYKYLCGEITEKPDWVLED